VLDDIFTGTIKKIHVCDLTLHNTLLVGDDTTLVGHGEAVIDPLEQDRGIHINGVSSVIQGFTITNGASDKGGAIYCDGEEEDFDNWLQSQYRTQLIDMTLSGNTADDGGGLYTESLCPTEIVNSSIVDNQATNGGGAYINSDIIINTVLVDNNEANTSYGIGGGLYFAGERYETANNNPPFNIITYQSISAMATDLTATNNRAYAGGGIFLENADIHATGSSVSGNVSLASGAGMYSINGISRFDSSTFSTNTASGYGGAVYLLEPGGPNGNGYITNRFVCGEGTVIERNVADSQSAAIDIEFDSQFRAEECVFGTGNDANSDDIFTLGSSTTHSPTGNWWGFCDDLSCGEIENCTDGLDNLGNGLIDYYDPSCSPTSNMVSVLELTTDWFDHTQLLPDESFTYIDEGRDILYRIDTTQTSCINTLYANAFNSFTGLFDSNLNLIEGKEYSGALGQDQYSVSAGVYFVGFTPPDNMRRSASFIFDVSVDPGACN
ncbi:MAG: hypothetical protein VX026_12015, partial [Myxococcota bacterium]|nr:hypothetical protein [Myxococcota bacterium]